MAEYKFPKAFSYTQGSGSGTNTDEDCRTLGCNAGEKCSEVNVGKAPSSTNVYRCIKDCIGNAEDVPRPGGFDCKYCEDGKWVFKMPRFCRIPTDNNNNVLWPAGTHPSTHIFDETIQDCPSQTYYQNFPDNSSPVQFGYDLICPCVPKKEASYIKDSGKYNTEQLATWTEGDFNFDGIVDILDVAELMSSPGPSTTNFANPDDLPAVFFTGAAPSSKSLDKTSDQECYGCSAYDCECEDVGWITVKDFISSTEYGRMPFRFVYCCPENTSWDEPYCVETVGSGADSYENRFSPAYRNELIACEGQAPGGCEAVHDPDTFRGLRSRAIPSSKIVSTTTSNIRINLTYTVINQKPLVIESQI